MGGNDLRTNTVEPLFHSVQFPDQLGRRGDMRDDSAGILFQSSLQEALVSSSGIGRDAQSLIFVHHSFPLPTTSSSTLKGAQKDGFGEAVVACDMPEPCATGC